MIDKLFKAYERPRHVSQSSERRGRMEDRPCHRPVSQAQPAESPADKVKLEDSMVVGRDMRPSSPSLAKSLIDGIRSVGMNVIDVGMIDTSMIYFAINHLDAVGGIQTTASHNPAQYNGFKISGPKARPIGAASGLDDIKRITASLRVGQTGLSGKLTEQDLWPEYRKHVLQFLDLKRPLKVVVDGSNGMAGKMVPAIFSNIPNLQIVPLLFEITGSFTHDPNPLVEQNLDMLKAQDRPGKARPGRLLRRRC